MKNYILIFGLTLVLITVSFCGCLEEKTEDQKEAGTSDTLGSLGYRHYGFGINPPGGELETYQNRTIWKTNWTMNESGFNEYESISGVKFTLENKDFVSFGIYKNFNWAIQPLFSSTMYEQEYEIYYIPQNYQSISEYGSEKYVQPGWKDLLENLTFVLNETTTINDMDAYITTYIYEYNGISMKSKSVFVEKYSIIFELIYSAPLDVYDKYIEEVDESMNSFTIQ